MRRRSALPAPGADQTGHSAESAARKSWAPGRIGPPTLYDGEALAHQATWCFELRDQRKPGVRLGDELELHRVELPKARRLPPGPGPYALDRPLSAWIDFFTHWQDEARMAELNEPAVRRWADRLLGAESLSAVITG